MNVIIHRVQRGGYFSLTASAYRLEVQAKPCVITDHRHQGIQFGEGIEKPVTILISILWVMHFTCHVMPLCWPQTGN